LKNLNLNDPASVAKYNTPVAQPTAAQQAEWSKDATADQKADWRYGRQGAASPAGTTKPAATKDPKVLSLQQKLISLGAKIQADGIMGPKTQAAMKQYGLDINGNSTAKNVAAPGQPPATLMKDTPAGQLQTQAAQQAKAASDRSATTTDPGRTSLNANITVAQPTGPIAPTAINNGSGVGKNATLDPAQASAAKDAMNDPTISARDKAFLAQMQGNTQAAAPTAPAAPTTPVGAKGQARARAQAQPVSENLDRIIDLVKYLK
jgi:hypothetical protein